MLSRLVNELRQDAVRVTPGPRQLTAFAGAGHVKTLCHRVKRPAQGRHITVENPHPGIAPASIPGAMAARRRAPSPRPNTRSRKLIALEAGGSPA